MIRLSLRHSKKMSIFATESPKIHKPQKPFDRMNEKLMKLSLLTLLVFGVTTNYAKEKSPKPKAKHVLVLGLETPRSWVGRPALSTFKKK